MKGRLERKMEIEKEIQSRIADMPEYMTRYYYSIMTQTPLTKKRYIFNVIRFLSVIGAGKPVTLKQLNAIDAFAIQKYISDISYFEKKGETRELSETTKANIYSCLSAFFSFLAANNMIENNPFTNGAIKRPKPRETEVVFLTADEVKAVEKTIINGAGTSRMVSRQKNWKYRDFLLFWLPVVNGIRVGALSEINVDDIDFKDRSIRVVEKGNKPMKIYFDEKTEFYMHLWLGARDRILAGKKCDALFISNQKTRIGVRTIEVLIGKYTFSATGRQVSPHKLRATFATALYKKKRDIELVQKALHHTSPVPTQRYVKVFDQDIRDAVNSKLYD